MKKVLFVFGTRPEAIKMAPVINEFKKDLDNFDTIVVVTAQHREMLDQVLSLFEIVPDYDLDLMAPNQTLESLTAKILTCIADLLKDIKPDIVLVQGDTTTTYATALASFYNKIPVAHIEAGLRTNNIYSPFPEEINRRMTTSMASYHFPPTEKSRQNLLNEDVNDNVVIVTGNTVIDALLTVSNKIDLDSIKYDCYFADKFNIQFNEHKIILVTGHRRESFGDGFENICNAIKKLAENNNIKIIYPVHLNPNVQEPVSRILSNIENVHLIPPQDYVSFVFLMKKAYIILTDSGGVQEEAPSLGKPVLVMRDTTERPEGIVAGTAKLVGTDINEILSTVELLLNNQVVYEKMAKAINPYGNGSASKSIYNNILNKLR
ncbi:UDP-N-acetylglucosamine 2-epimerase (non-hydrolyzing) [Candidatus Woesearchaeota archaeon]|jgi:UDP-N-acetylglucosamine 2-epimerase (non-hydrolysing)|nr:UDP-N-acetylglucosamine 2-epimerase (non-hydrolyzing) [Candidatus Neomarinimicrobiota bacterium]MBT4731531.1 UDP-N-acetylglucosamine 2-epimerase (non-hydrolyzing) [Candidatus Woesearchaeota archaeon]MBT6112208.1 UDP-N-acetylglucosamine 2-epimerase (non-hydrolyzing) [Candidatus Neomarinimicrobiota bacterium]MBT7899840.1 UDP-N-acetylglucosamine 2-epimerase (non-hydrolyzing) [Candidatus Neomarinimicrobiota bacterium]